MIRLHEWIETITHAYTKLLDKPSKATGLIKQPEDKRDYELPLTGVKEKKSTNFRGELPLVTNQGSYNSCTAHAIAPLVMRKLKQKHTLSFFDFSEHYQWYYHRLMEGNEDKNSGAFLRDGFKVLKQYGLCHNRHHSNLTHYLTRPNARADKYAEMVRDYFLEGLGDYYAINPKDVLKVLSNSEPFVFGIQLDENFMKLNLNNNYWVQGKKNYGYHAMVVVGHRTNSDDSVDLLIRNSWGRHWGNGGHCWMSLSHFTKTWRSGGAFDCWTIK